MEIKILASGDLHLGRRSSGVPLDREFGSTAHVWRTLVDEAVRRRVDLVVLTGDVIDRANRYFEAIGALQQGFATLAAENIPVYMVAGNHDFDVLVETLDPDRYPNVHLLGGDGSWQQTHFAKNGRRLRIVGRSFISLHDENDPLDAYDLPPTDDAFHTIGLLHGDVGNPFSKYAPIDADKFARQGVDTWLLGHIHKPEVLRESSPHVRYPGSPQALSAKESGVHGAVLLSVAGRGEVDFEILPLSAAYYDSIHIDFGECDEEIPGRDVVIGQLRDRARELLAGMSHVRMLFFDVTLSARTNNARDFEKTFYNLHEAEVREGDVDVVVRKASFQLMPSLNQLEGLAQQNTPAGTLAQTIIALKAGDDTPWIRDLMASWRNEKSRLENSGTYADLIRSSSFEDDDPEPHTVLLSECERLLGELLSQRPA